MSRSMYKCNQIYKVNIYNKDAFTFYTLQVQYSYSV